MTLTSALAGAEDGLLAILQAQAALPSNPLAGVALQLGDPGTGLAPEHVFIEERASSAERWDVTSGGAQEKQEQFVLGVVVYVHKQGNDYKGTRDRAQALAHEVEKAVAAGPTLNGKVFDSSVTAIERDGGITDTGRVIAMVLSVTAIAFLT